MLCALCCLLPLGVEPSLAELGEQSIHLNYTGSLKSVARDGTKADVKKFRLFARITGTDDGGWTIVWVVTDNGAGGFAWPERFGQVAVDAKGKLTGVRTPRILQEYQDNDYIMGLWAPKVALPRNLKIGDSWADGLLRYVAFAEQKIDGHTCYRIAYTHPKARHGTIWARKSDGLLVKAERREFMGRGDRFQLTLGLSKIGAPKEDEAAATQTVFAKLFSVQKGLDRKPDTTATELSKEQLASVTKSLADLKSSAEKTPLKDLVASIEKDIKSQSSRETDLAGLAKQFVGKPVPKITLKSADGSKMPELKGIVLLHLWKYRDKPLKQPYGQVGYLDFLNNKARKRRYGLTIVGVAIDPRFGDKTQKAAASRSVQKFREFFNLGYPIAADSGAILKSLGDPRRFGAKLPLWVLIAPNGKVRHYHAGLYNIDTRKGLEALEKEIVALVKEARAKK